MADKSVFPGLDGWIEAWTSALRQTPAADAQAEMAARLFDPRNWLGVGGAALEQPFETVLGLPRLADVPDLDRKLLGLLQNWAAMTQRSAEYGSIVAQVWMKAYADFLPALQTAAAEGKPVTGGRELLDRWTATVNERLLKAQRSQDFLEAQRRLLDSILKSRAAEHELVEIGAKAMDLPTRSEMDDVHKTLHELKREVRRLKRQLAAAEEAGKPSASRLKVVAGSDKSERGKA